MDQIIRYMEFSEKAMPMAFAFFGVIMNYVSVTY